MSPTTTCGTTQLCRTYGVEYLMLVAAQDAATNQTTREHPLDGRYRQLYQSQQGPSMPTNTRPRPRPAGTQASNIQPRAPADVPRPADAGLVAAAAVAAAAGHPPPSSFAAASAAVLAAAEELRQQRHQSLAAAARQPHDALAGTPMDERYQVLRFIRSGSQRAFGWGA
jgi:hypothetical protein